MKTINNIIVKELKKIPDIIVEINKDLSSYSTLGLRASGDLITVLTISALTQLVRFFYRKKINYHILGGGANSILSEIIKLPIIKLKFSWDKSIFDNVQKFYTLPASIGLSTLTKYSITHYLKGWEVFAGIPGTLGGAICMNAGNQRGSISAIVKKVKIIKKNGTLIQYNLTKNNFSYRQNLFLKKGDIIYQVVLGHKGIDKKIPKIIQNDLTVRKAKQPLDKKTCGSLFKNKLCPKTCLAAKFIDILGMKGFGINDIIVSEKHANFIENRASGNDSDTLAIVKVLQDQLELYFGINFEMEAKVFNDK